MFKEVLCSKQNKQSVKNWGRKKISAKCGQKTDYLRSSDGKRQPKIDYKLTNF